MSVSYVPLRVHSEYSIVHGLGSVDAVLDQAVRLGFTAIALTDEVNFFAAIKFYQSAKKRGIQPIFGSDLRLNAGKTAYPFTLLCQNDVGFRQLTKLISRAYQEGKRHEGIPWIERAWLTPENTAGLIALSGGVQGELGQVLVNEGEAAAKQVLNFWQTLFPEDRFYVEISRVGMSGEVAYLEQMLPLAEALELAVVATHPSYFLEEKDFSAHEVRVAIHDGYTLEDPHRPRRFTDQQYLVDAADMLERFADCPVALSNTGELAKRCQVQFTLGQVYLPQFPIPPGMTESDYFKNEANKGLEERLDGHVFEGEKTKTVYLERLHRELEVIISMGFTGYFLIVADFIQWSKQNGVPVGPGRGSGAGSLVAYALKITDIDPLPYDLLFERFLNPERVSMPDFDIDFCMEGRDRVIEYVAQKYGRQSVSQIITFGSMAAKAVVRDVGRVLGLAYGFVDGIAKLIPFDLGMTLQLALEQAPELKRRFEEEEEVKSLLEMALKLEGTVRNVGKHAGGVVIAPSDLTDFAPIYCEEGSDQIVVQYDKEDVETIGLIKFDFLGLRNLTIIEAAIQNINQNQGEAPVFRIQNIPLQDPKTFEMLKKGETSAVFQLESRGMKELIKRLKPDCFEDIVALVALFRPGPLQSGMVDDFIARKHGHAKIVYPHPDTQPILKSTYGVILYQEQVMLIPQVLAGYTLGGADLLRRAMGKKKPEEMAQQRDIFVAGALKNNISEEVSGGIFDLMEKFAGYGFNKSHSAAYALVAYQTAYLKAHYPAEFMAAVLSSDMDNTDKVVGFVEECKAMHLKLYPPDIASSAARFTVVEAGALRYGLAAIKGVGMAAIEAIMAERNDKPFIDLFDFCKRMDLRKVNKRVIEALIFAGAMDKLGPSRAILLASLEVAMQEADQHERAEDAGQEDLFGLFSEAEVALDSKKTGDSWQQAEDWSVYERVMHEKKVLGWCLSGHPLDEYRELFRALRVQPLSRLTPTARGESVALAGMITEVRRIKTKRGSFLTVIGLEDFSRKVEVTCFGEVADLSAALLKPETKVVIDAEVQIDDFSGGMRGVAKKIHALEDYRSVQARQLQLTLTEKQAAQGDLIRIKESLHAHRGGPCPVVLFYARDDSRVSCELGRDWSVTLSDVLLSTLAPYQPQIFYV